MMRTIAQKEFTSAIRDNRLLLSGIIILILIITATVTGIKAYEKLADEQLQAQTTTDTNFKNQPARHPHRVAHYGSYAFRPKSFLSLLDFGIDSFTGTMIYLEAHQQNSANFSQAGQSSSLIRMGEMTIAFVMQILIPLLIIFLCFTAFTQEREDGTLKVLLSQGIAPLDIAKAKIRGYSKVLSLVIIPSLLLASAFLFRVSAFTWDADTIARLSVFILSYLLYFYVFLTGSVLVSFNSKNSQAALTTLLAIWILTCIIIPKAAANIGSALYAAPAKAEMDALIHQEAQNGVNGHTAENKRTTEFKKDLLLKYRVDSVNQLPVNIDGLIMAEGEKYSSEVYQKHFEKLVDTYLKQNFVSVLSGLINPYSSLREISKGMAASDYQHYVHFLNAAEKYRYNLAQHLNELQAKKLHYKDKETRLDNNHWKEYPSFSYKIPTFIWSIKNHLISLSALLCWCLLLHFIFIYQVKNTK